MMTFVLLSLVSSGYYLIFCGSLLSGNSYSGVSTVNSLNSGSGNSVVSGINSYNLLGSYDGLGINGLSLLVAVAGNHSNAEQNSERKNYFLHFLSQFNNNKTMCFCKRRFRDCSFQLSFSKTMQSYIKFYFGGYFFSKKCVFAEIKHVF